MQESAFLVTSACVLMTGMVFASKGFQPGVCAYVRVGWGDWGTRSLRAPPSRACCRVACASAHAGTIGYVLLNIVAAAGIVGSTLVFMSLLVFEIYRSIKFARVHDVARQVEEEAVEVPTITHCTQ